jgi:hypothetical protein
MSAMTDDERREAEEKAARARRQLVLEALLRALIGRARRGS